MTDEGTAPDYAGVVVIEWPPPNRATPHSAMPARLIAVFDAVTGQLIPVWGADVHADPDGLVTADLTLPLGKDGNPIIVGPRGERLNDLVVVDDEAVTGTFTYLVTEMRVRGGYPPAPTASTGREQAEGTVT